MTQWPRSRPPEPDDLPYEAPITMGEVEERMQQGLDELADLAAESERRAVAASNAEADWVVHLSKVTLRQERSGGKSSEAYCMALAIEEVDPVTEKSGEELYRAWKDAQTLVGANNKAVRAVEKAVDSYRTLSANLRAVT